MWEMLPEEKKQEYKRMILAFASLTEMFAQKAENEEELRTLSPIINSKYQETVFQRVFNASAEDIKNTSYDASLDYVDDDGNETKFLIGIKTFGIASGAQKVAQFKANHAEWSEIINKMRANSQSIDGKVKTEEEINRINNPLYLELAKEVAKLRNMRIRSSESNIQGFSVDKEKDNIQTVYHVLMPSKKGDSPAIYVGETDYAQIDIDKIEVVGCTGVKNPTNFKFTDGKHNYRYTAADSQLLMEFKNYDIVKEKWDVVYADDAYALFADLAEKLYGTAKQEDVESYSWKITNDNGEVERFSGFNNFYGVGSKISYAYREKRIEDIQIDFENKVDNKTRLTVVKHLKEYLLEFASTKEEKEKKVLLRNKISELIRETQNEEFVLSVEKLLYRPKNEMYIPIPKAREFHTMHPNFFGPGIGTFKENSKKLALDKRECEFNLIFEPSGDKIRAFITQDDGKGIESVEKQSYLGEWILRGVFQLPEYQPLTATRLNEVGINGIRLYKIGSDPDIHLQFIWIEEENPPKDYIG